MHTSFRLNKWGGFEKTQETWSPSTIWSDTDLKRLIILKASKYVKINILSQTYKTFLIQREPGNMRRTDEFAIWDIMLNDTLLIVNNKLLPKIKIMKSTFFSSAWFTYWQVSLASNIKIFKIVDEDFKNLILFW